MCFIPLILALYITVPSGPFLLCVQRYYLSIANLKAALFYEKLYLAKISEKRK